MAEQIVWKNDCRNVGRNSGRTTIAAGQQWRHDNIAGQYSRLGQQLSEMT